MLWAFPRGGSRHFVCCTEMLPVPRKTARPSTGLNSCTHRGGRESAPVVGVGHRPVGPSWQAVKGSLHTPSMACSRNPVPSQRREERAAGSGRCHVTHLHRA